MNTTTSHEQKQPAADTPQWHAMEADAVFSQLQVDTKGLSADEAAERHKRFGANVLDRDSGEGPLEILIRQVTSPLVYVLIAAGIAALMLAEVVDGLVVFGVVVLNTIIGFVQEYRASKAIESLTRMVPEMATVLRDGEQREVPVAELVPGDVVILEAGDKVPADLRLFQSRNFRADEAALTGESEPVSKNTEPVESDVVVGDRACMAFGGTLVTSGTARGVVIATGGATELGRISEMLEQTRATETPLTRNIAILGKWLTAAILATAAAFMIVGLLRGYPFADAALVAISVAVAAIPEGLPAVITISLAIGVQRMARRRAVVRRLPAVETLGSTTVICSDKTGTLTRNEMTVTRLWTPAASWELTGVGYAPEGELKQDGRTLDELPERAHELLLAGVLCNDAALWHEEGEGWRINGDPTEAAMVVAAQKVGLDPKTVRHEHQRIDVVPFESEQKFMATLHADHDGSVIYVKGAPDVLLQRAASGPDGAPLDEQAFNAAIDAMAREGQRVLAVARLRTSKSLTGIEAEDVSEGLEILGLTGMIDPPREEAIRAIEACHAAGVTVKMITGDHPVTAMAIARELNLVQDGDEAVTGRELGHMDEATLDERAMSSNVFARVAPEHKLRLVESLQRQTQIVAMTGDGVNDAPALKKADIGVAMGITGTAVSKESAAIVLTDDNFATIEAAVEEGRRVFDNLVKAIAFMLPTNLGQALTILVGVATFPIIVLNANGAGGGGEEVTPLLPILPAQALWMNLVVTVALALPLAFEAMEPDVMRRPPRRPDKPILDLFILWRTVLVGVVMAGAAVALFLYRYYAGKEAGMPVEEAMSTGQTMAVTTLMFIQIFYTVSCRSLRSSVLQLGLFTNRYVFAGIASVLLLQAAFVYAPVMNTLFRTSPLNPIDLLFAVLLGVIIVPIVAAEKAVRRRYGIAM